MIPDITAELREWLEVGRFQLKEGAPEEIVQMYEAIMHPEKRALEKAKKRDPKIIDILIR